MKIRWYVGLVGLLCILVIGGQTSCVADQRAKNSSGRIKVIEIDGATNGRDVHLQVGDELKLSLRENRSTGYVWELTQDGSPALRRVGDTYESGAVSRPGSPGSRQWTFKAEETGQTKLELQLKRSWEHLPSKEVFTCNVVIDKPPV